MKSLKKALDDQDRAAKASISNLVVEKVSQKIQTMQGVPVYVELVEAYSNTKALDSALKKIRAISPDTSALLVSVDSDTKKVFALSAVPKVRFFNAIVYKFFPRGVS